MAGHVACYFPAYEQAKALIDSDMGTEYAIEVEGEPCFRELSAFVDALTGGSTPPVSVYAAHGAVRAAPAALQAIKTLLPVTIG